jgi:hypothetical protein
LWRSWGYLPKSHKIGVPSATQAQLGYQSSIPIDVLAAKIIQQAPSLPDQHQQAPATVVVVAVGAEMVGKVVDPLGEQSHLNLGRAGVTIVLAEFLDDLLRCLHDA